MGSMTKGRISGNVQCCDGRVVEPDTGKTIPRYSNFSGIPKKPS